MQITGWVAEKVGAPLRHFTRDAEAAPREVVVHVAGCGVCHTDLGFYYDGVPTRHPFPLVLGHEISGTVLAAGPGAEGWVGKQVVVPAVIPCGECAACSAGRGSICPKQIFPGCDVHGGFATHVIVPANGLCPVPDLTDSKRNPHGLDLASLSVIADAVSTPYQALVRCGLSADDLAIFVGAGGVGGFGVQVAAAMGAHVAAIDIDPERLELIARHGAELTLNAAEKDFKSMRNALRAFAEKHSIPTWRQKAFETSGTVRGQETAFGLLGHGGYLGVVGYTPEKLELRLSNLMAFDATAQGNWGCVPEHYPAIVDLVLQGKIALAPFVEPRPLATINEAFADLHARRVTRRLILIPEETQ